MEKKKLKNDIILVAVIAVCLLLSLTAFLLLRGEGGYAVIIVDGKETARFPLSKDSIVTIISPNSDDHNTLKIESGKASITSASCPDGICVSHHAISHNGETIVCLPNKLVIKIISESESTIDAIS